MKPMMDTENTIENRYGANVIPGVFYFSGVKYVYRTLSNAFEMQAFQKILKCFFKSTLLDVNHY